MPFNPVTNSSTRDRGRLKADGGCHRNYGISPVLCQCFPEAYFLLYQDILKKKKIDLSYANTSYQQINAPAPPGICDYGAWARGDTVVAHGTMQNSRWTLSI